MMVCDATFRFSPQLHGSCLILRKVKDVRVPLLLKVRVLWLAGAGDCGSQAGTVSNFRGVILKGKWRLSNLQEAK